MSVGRGPAVLASFPVALELQEGTKDTSGCMNSDALGDSPPAVQCVCVAGGRALL